MKQRFLGLVGVQYAACLVNPAHMTGADQERIQQK
jgi:hypothetical protein